MWGVGSGAVGASSVGRDSGCIRARGSQKGVRRVSGLSSLVFYDVLFSLFATTHNSDNY